MTKQRALVTGASGFVGSHLVRHLLGADWQVHAIVRPESHQSALKQASGLRVHEHTGSMDSMLSILAETQPDVVFHLASLFLSEHQPADIERLVQSNILFGTQLVEAMAQVGASALVNTGTAWQHYQNREYSPVNLYAATKQAFEDLLQYYVEAHGLRAITLQLSDTYGPDDPRPKLINLLRRAAQSHVELGMSEGYQEIDLVHVSDVVTAYLHAARRILINNSVYHEKFSVSSETGLSLRELVSFCEQAWGKQLTINWGQRLYRKREVMKPWQGRTLPEWCAQVPLLDGLRGLSV